MKGTVIVTGGAGFIGSHVVERLIKEGYRVMVIDSRECGCLYVDSPAVKYSGFPVDEYSIKVDLERDYVEHIIHLAAWSNVRESMKDPIRLYEDNVMTTARILDGIYQSNWGDNSIGKSLIFASSSAVENPQSHYGVSKAASEMMLDIYRRQARDIAVCNDWAVAVSSLRFANVYGPRQSNVHGTLISNFVDCALTGNRPTIYGDGSQERDYIYVTDVVDAILTTMENKLSETMNVSRGVSYSVDEVYDATKKAADHLGLDLETPEYVPAKTGDKDKVKMSPSPTLLATGWDAKVELYRGIINQIEWTQKMEGDWNDDHDIYGKRGRRPNHRQKRWSKSEGRMVFE